MHGRDRSRSALGQAPQQHELMPTARPVKYMVAIQADAPALLRQYSSATTSLNIFTYDYFG